MVVNVDISQEAEEHIQTIWGANFSREMLEAVTVKAYQERKIGTGLVRQILGFEDRWETIAFLSELGVYPNYDAEDLVKDRANLEKMLGKPPK